MNAGQGSVQGQRLRSFDADRRMIAISQMRATIFFGWTVPAVNAVSDLETSAELRAILAAISLNRFAPTKLTPESSPAPPQL